MTPPRAKSKLPKPLGGLSPPELALAQAPLERVIAQVRFPVILKIESKPVVAQFQDAVRADYPVLRESRNQSVMIQMGPNGPMALNSATPVWQFCDAGDLWKVSLARDSLTIETTAYRSREDFLTRWNVAINALWTVFQPAIFERLGVRYVDRVTGERHKKFERLFNPDLLGSALASLKPGIKHSINESLFAVEEGEMLLRWGIMPPTMSPDPGAISSIPHESFVLDIDVWSIRQEQFDVDALSRALQKLAMRAYSVFRFAVTDEFLKSYGGKL